MAVKMICQVEFYDSNLNKKESIIGEVYLGQLFNKQNSWITVETKSQQGTNWVVHQSIIPKSDIEKITFFSAECYVSVNKQDLGLYLSVLPHIAQET